jgi:hypothetical protein
MFSVEWDSMGGCRRAKPAGFFDSLTLSSGV